MSLIDYIVTYMFYDLTDTDGDLTKKKKKKIDYYDDGYCIDREYEEGDDCDYGD